MKTVSPTSEQLAYAAGFFDGEGCIRIQTHSRRCRTMMLSVTACQVTEYPLGNFVQWFGGTVKLRWLKYREGRRPLHTWQVSSLQAEHFLRQVLPYLIAKRTEAELALQFRATFRPQYGDRSRMPDNVITLRRSMQEGLKKIRHEKRRLAYA
mgnify:CR=1 FL=1